MTESLQNKMKITKLSKKEAGGGEKHDYYFTPPILHKTELNDTYNIISA